MDSSTKPVELKSGGPPRNGSGEGSSSGATKAVVLRKNTTTFSFIGSLLEPTTALKGRDPESLKVFLHGPDANQILGFDASDDLSITCAITNIGRDFDRRMSENNGNYREVVTFCIGMDLDEMKNVYSPKALPMLGNGHSPVRQVENLKEQNPVWKYVEELLHIDPIEKDENWMRQVTAWMEAGYYLNDIVQDTSSSGAKKRRRVGMHMSTMATQHFVDVIREFAMSDDVDKHAVKELLKQDHDIQSMIDDNLFAVSVVPIILLFSQGFVYGNHLVASIDLLREKVKGTISLLLTDKKAREEAFAMFGVSFSMLGLPDQLRLLAIDFRLKYALLNTVVRANARLTQFAEQDCPGGVLKLPEWVLRVILLMVAYYGAIPPNLSPDDIQQSLVKVRRDAMDSTPGGLAIAAASICQMLGTSSGKGKLVTKTATTSQKDRGPLGMFIRNLLRLSFSLGRHPWAAFIKIQDTNVDLILDTLEKFTECTVTMQKILEETSIPRNFMSTDMLNIDSNPRDFAGKWATYVTKTGLNARVMGTIAGQISSHMATVEEKANMKKAKVTST